MLFQELPPFIDCSHLIIVEPALLPDKVIDPLFVPLQTVSGDEFEGDNVPGMVAAVTFIVPVADKDPQPPVNGML